MILETKEQQVRYVQNYFEHRFNHFLEQNEEENALSLYKEMIIESHEEPSHEWLFLPCIENI
jgi:hypothetical protein